jgi:hypothetical protein
VGQQTQAYRTAPALIDQDPAEAGDTADQETMGHHLRRNEGREI